MTKILVVDDSNFAHALAVAVINSFGHEMISAQSEKECLEQVMTNKPDCVLMDIHMPETSGLEILDHLMIKAPTLPVIMLTADIQTTTREQCIAHGARTVMHKPISLDEYKEVMTDVMGLTFDKDE